MLDAAILSYEDRGELAGMIIQLLDTWELDASKQIVLLSLPEKTPVRAIRKYRKNTPFPESKELDEKILHLIGIADALRTTYPRNSLMRAQWMNRPHRRLNGQSPLRHMYEHGVKGFKAVRSELDCAFAWDDSE